MGRVGPRQTGRVRQAGCTQQTRRTQQTQRAQRTRHTRPARQAQQTPRQRGLIALLAALLLLTGCSATAIPVPVPEPLSQGGRQSLDSRARSQTGSAGYWTRDRLRMAYGNKSDGAPESAANLSAVQLGQGAVGEGYNFKGAPQVGTFFFRIGPDVVSAGHSCSGVVVNSSSGTIVVSAAHCWYGFNAQDVVFIPQFSMRGGKPQMPYGIWEVSGNAIHIDPRFAADTAESVGYDVAVMSMAPNVADQTIQEVVGGVDMVLNPATEQAEVEMVGYPASDSEDGTYTSVYPRHCRNATTTYKEAGFDFFRIECPGMATGVSGGPWLVRNGKGGWDLVAVTGGGQDGGGYTDDVSIGVPVSDVVTGLIAKAEAFDLSQGRDWRQAKLMAAGNFGAVRGTDDLAVVWLDGTIELYHGSGDLTKPFMGMRVIGSERDGFGPLRMITTADLDGSGYDDIVTLGWDGRVLLVQDPGTGARHKPVHLNPHQPLDWTRARQIVGGDFSPDGNNKKDDLLVVWEDGTTSVFLHVSKHGLSQARPWPIGGLPGLVGPAGGSKGPLSAGIDGVVTAGNFGGGSLTDVMVVGKDSNGKSGAWLITDDAPKGRLPVYRAAAYDFAATGVDPSKVLSVAAGNFDSTGSSSDIVFDTSEGGVHILGGVSADSPPRADHLTTVVQAK